MRAEVLSRLLLRLKNWILKSQIRLYRIIRTFWIEPVRWYSSWTESTRTVWYTTIVYKNQHALRPSNARIWNTRSPQVTFFADLIHYNRTLRNHVTTQLKSVILNVTVYKHKYLIVCRRDTVKTILNPMTMIYMRTVMGVRRTKSLGVVA